MPLEPSHHRSWLNRLSPKAQGVIAINAAAVIFGTAALYGKLNVSPVWIVAMRAGFGALTLALIGAWKRDFSSFPRRHWQPLLLSGLLLAVHWVTFFVSVQQAGVAVATLTFATFPLFTVLVEASHQRRFPSVVEIAVGLVIIVAVALLVDPQAGQRNLWGAVSGLVSGFSYALFWRSSKKLDDAALSATNLSFWQNAMVFALLMPALFFSVPVPSTAVDWMSLVALGAFNTAIMLLIYLYALQRLSPSTCSGFIALEPVYAIFFAALFFDEPITPWIAVSVILILGASFTLLKIEKDHAAHIA
ncbi:MAG: DMT family transporter [Hyphomicrobium sp.]|nr:DMT family transporter [Hyphomicrobium sp.]